jgi:DNA helicase-2/ATP-dependent DNA helicase PcrA
MTFTPRPSQRAILEYTGGRLGISAVPGSGKTHTLSALAAKIVASGLLAPQQEVLIVTLVNSAVDNFGSRIGDFITSRGLIPHLGYRVRTLHGLAHDIVREDPPRVGLDKKFTIIDETTSLSMICAAADAWLHAHADSLEAWRSRSLDSNQIRRVAKDAWPSLIESLAVSFIRSAKDRQLTPQTLRLALDSEPSELPLAEAGVELYADYQRGLAYRGAVDFDDLIRLAFEMLEASPELLEGLRYRWPFILEDEAQDSSAMQQKILSRLAGENGNWVRVGDPNQAIFETFTTADPKHLRDFIRSNRSVDMPESGRCQPSVMNLANYLLRWASTAHPLIDARDALTPPQMQPAPPGDPQSNPPDDPAGVSFTSGRLTPEAEVEQVAESLQVWLPEHRDHTVAVLTATNDHAARMVEALKRRGIDYLELLRSTSPTRAAAGALSLVLGYLAAPESSAKLAQAYRVWRRGWRQDPEKLVAVDRVAAALRRLKRVEDLVYPIAAQSARGFGGPGGDLGPIEALTELDVTPEGAIAELASFAQVIHRWHGATMLPIDQLVLSVAPDIFESPADLALAHKLALVMRQLADEHPEWRLPDLTPNLREIARNERRFIGFSSDDSGFDPQDHPGKVVVSTVHKAKGLEWDRVYLMALNTYDYPAGQVGDRFISEKWFLRDDLNLEAEAIAQLKAATTRDDYQFYEEGGATSHARLQYVRERLRLLYVGITRARKEIMLSWNTGRRGDATASLAFSALAGWWEAGHPEIDT